MVPAVAARQDPISQVVQAASPGWLLAVLAHLSMQGVLGFCPHHQRLGCPTHNSPLSQNLPAQPV